MAQTYGVGTPISREDIARALHEWQTALREVRQSSKAEIYACAEELVVEYLSDRTTFGALLGVYFSPTRELRRLVAELCANGAISLRPHLLVGASCAQRLRLLLEEADA
jgi:hypothetical protein